MGRGRPPVYTGCKIEGCETKHYALGYCRSHWEKNRKGTLNKVSVNAGRCTVTGCDHQASTRRLCQSHYTRLWLGKSIDSPIRRWHSEPSYWTAHRAVYAARGKAADQDCAWCGRPAEEWALRADAKMQRDNISKAAGKLFSTDVYDYFPMCKPHHRSYDSQHGVNKLAVV